jgi:hypothetical protein
MSEFFKIIFSKSIHSTTQVSRMCKLAEQIDHSAALLFDNLERLAIARALRGSRGACLAAISFRRLLFSLSNHATRVVHQMIHNFVPREASHTCGRCNRLG